MKNEEGRFLDMYSSEVRLGDSVIVPSHNIIGEVSDFAEDDKLEVEAKYMIGSLNNKVHLYPLAVNTYCEYESTELISRHPRPFYNVYEFKIKSGH